MKTLTYLLLAGMTLFVCCTSPASKEQTKEPEPTLEKVVVVDEKDVIATMRKYKDVLESLDVTESYALFSDSSQVIEQGKIEGTYADYIANHIGPELGHFSSFTFDDYSIEVIMASPYAYTTESYVYKIVLKEDGREIERKAVATSILNYVNGEWKIIKTHSSSRAVRND